MSIIYTYKFKKFHVFYLIIPLLLFWIYSNGINIQLNYFRPNPPSLKQVILPQLSHRNEFDRLINMVNASVIVEIGVQRGVYSEFLAKSSANLVKFYGIDPWLHYESFKDTANVGQGTQDSYFKQTKNRLARFGDRIQLIRNFSNLAVDNFSDDSIDFIYIDGRHDYCGCLEDITLYWPKVKTGGIISGHDYQGDKIDESNDWRVCANGSLINGSVKRAVDEFVVSHKIVQFKYTPDRYSSWYFQKPIQN